MTKLYPFLFSRGFSKQFGLVWTFWSTTIACVVCYIPVVNKLRIALDGTAIICIHSIICYAGLVQTIPGLLLLLPLDWHDLNMERFLLSIALTKWFACTVVNPGVWVCWR